MLEDVLDEVLLDVLDEVELPVDVLVDVLLPPVAELVLDPPVEVEVLDPPVDVLEPPLDVDVDPPVLLDVVETKKPPLLLPLLPTKKPPPPKKPPPNPPVALPPTITGGVPPLPPIGPSASRSTSGAGAGLLTTVTAPGAQLVVVTVLRTMRLGAARCTGFALIGLDLMWRMRSGGFSATCTAPPPITAPPQAQAQSFAKAIRTDIAEYSYRAQIPFDVEPWESPYTE